MAWPNIITLVRLGLVPAFVWAAFNLAERLPVALTLFAVMTVGDALDGLVARRLGKKSHFGAFLDPIADKILMTCAYLVLSAPGVVTAPMTAVPEWLAVIVIGRDVSITLGAGVVRLATGRLEPRPSIVGKASTFMQAVAIFAVLLSHRLNGQVVFFIFVWTAATTFVSGLDYLAIGWRQLDHARLPESVGRDSSQGRGS